MNDEQRKLLREIYADKADAVITAFDRLSAFMKNPNLSFCELVNPRLYGKQGLKRSSFINRVRTTDVAGELDSYRKRLEANVVQCPEGARIQEGDLAITLRENVPGLKGIQYKNPRLSRAVKDGRLVNTGQRVWSDSSMGNFPRY